MRIAGIAFIAIISFIAQAKISIWGVTPSFTVAVVYYAGIYNSPGKGLLAGSLLGIIEDSISGGILGPHLLAKGMAGYVSSLSTLNLFRWTPLLGMIFIALITALDGLTVYLVKALYETTPFTFQSFLRIILTGSLINSIIGFFIRPKNAS